MERELESLGETWALAQVEVSEQGRVVAFSATNRAPGMVMVGWGQAWGRVEKQREAPRQTELRVTPSSPGTSMATLRPWHGRLLGTMVPSVPLLSNPL